MSDTSQRIDDFHTLQTLHSQRMPQRHLQQYEQTRLLMSDTLSPQFQLQQQNIFQPHQQMVVPTMDLTHLRPYFSFPSHISQRHHVHFDHTGSIINPHQSLQYNDRIDVLHSNISEHHNRYKSPSIYFPAEAYNTPDIDSETSITNSIEFPSENLSKNFEIVSQAAESKTLFEWLTFIAPDFPHEIILEVQNNYEQAKPYANGKLTGYLLSLMNDQLLQSWGVDDEFDRVYILAHIKQYLAYLNTAMSLYNQPTKQSDINSIELVNNKNKRTRSDADFKELKRTKVMVSTATELREIVFRAKKKYEEMLLNAAETNNKVTWIKVCSELGINVKVKEKYFRYYRRAEGVAFDWEKCGHWKIKEHPEIFGKPEQKTDSQFTLITSSITNNNNNNNNNANNKNKNKPKLFDSQTSLSSSSSTSSSSSLSPGHEENDEFIKPPKDIITNNFSKKNNFHTKNELLLLQLPENNSIHQSFPSVQRNFPIKLNRNFVKQENFEQIFQEKKL